MRWSQGLGLLLVCAAAEECAAAVQGLWEQIPQPCADCLLVVKVCSQHHLSTLPVTLHTSPFVCFCF